MHSRESTNIALRRPVKASHRLNGPMLPSALTDGLPATIAHPMEPGLGTNFHFDIDLGRVFEAQALHSDNQWDATVYRLPIMARQHFWETRLFHWLAGAGGLAAVVGMVLVWARRRTARQMALMQAQTALAEERARIARDLHDRRLQVRSRAQAVAKVMRKRQSRSSGSGVWWIDMPLFTSMLGWPSFPKSLPRQL